MKLTQTFRLSVLTLFFSLLSFLSFSQEAILQGIVTDKLNTEPLIGATVQIGETGTTSDFDGRYRLSTKTGEVTVKITYVGYETMEQIITLTAGENKMDFALMEAATILNTATVTSGKFEKPLGEVTVSLEVIKPTLLESNNATSVDDVLGKVAGVEILDGQANIRGGSGYSYGAGSRVLLLVDDVPILQPDAGFPNWDDVPVENVEQIEVVKGAASALYGSSAMNGIINIRTGYAKSDPETRFSSFYTGYDSYKDETKSWWKANDTLNNPEGDTLVAPHEYGFSALHKQKFGKFDLVAGAYYLDRSGFRKDEYDQYGRLNINTRYRVTDRFSFGVNANINRGKSQSFFYWAGNGALTTTGEASTFSTTERTRYNIDPYADYYAENGLRHRFRGRFYSIDNLSAQGQSNSSRLFYGEYQTQKKFEEINLVATAGLVGQGYNIDAELYGDTIYTANNIAAYLQFDQKLFDRLNLSGGFRYERNVLVAPDENIIEGDTLFGGKEIEAKPVFRIGANYQAGQATYIRASWGQGYRFPTVAEKYIETNAGFPITSNPDLKSETGYTAEIGIKQGFKISNWTGFVDVAGFISEYRDMMEFNLSVDFTGFSFKSINVGNTSIKGIDVSVGGQGKIGEAEIGLIGGYTYLSPKYLDYDPAGIGQPVNAFDFVSQPGLYNAATNSDSTNVLKYRFRHTFKMDVQAKIKKFALGGSIAYNSYMESVDLLFEVDQVIPGLKEYRKENQTGTTVLDARMSYEITDNIKLSVLARNLFNTDYIRRPAYQEAPRSYTARVDFKF